ncbi:hypothetical protein SAMN02745216_05278 [Desulfatibacillum alkenivorans DSM 16219]|jgi:H+/gluconate symporter-like permease|uniref:Uncharacterized protein n=1 Tax=Desulfatibacillum alkenivorans DSM 16219 TaxID=1121393 RepID=A0A1M7B7J3_9BACT|nr:hypothetical protein [Desulfatibacillum alkenivorans]SHL50599.1 hypothetical protein SAMN02745216_05278 [Desulfatibacillum alkenivorans DSM 16219]
MKYIAIGVFLNVLYFFTFVLMEKFAVRTESMASNSLDEQPKHLPAEQKQSSTPARFFRNLFHFVWIVCALLLAFWATSEFPKLEWSMDNITSYESIGCLLIVFEIFSAIAIGCSHFMSRFKKPDFWGRL